MNNTDFKFIKHFALYMEGNAGAIRYSRKPDFKTKGKKFLNIIKKELQIEDCDIRYNEGGIGVSGDHVLHSNNLYINFNSEIAHIGIMYRACKSQKDYSGGTNNWMKWIEVYKSPETLIAKLSSIK